MKKKTKRLLYKISVACLIACTLFMVIVGSCFGASLTYPPDYVVASFDKTNWYNPDVEIQGVDTYKPQYYLDDISFDSTLVGYDDVAGGSFSPTQLSLGSPFYRYVPNIGFADDIRSTLSYTGQIDFINSTEQWNEGSFPLFFYNTFYRYYYGAPYGNTLISEFDTDYSLQDTGDYFSLTLSDMILNLSNNGNEIVNSVPTLTLGMFGNDVFNSVTYNVKLYIEYEKIQPEQIEGEWMYNRSIGYYSKTDTYTMYDDEAYYFEYSFNLYNDYYSDLREIVENNVQIVSNDNIVTSNYLYVKRLILEVFDEYGSIDPTYIIKNINYRNEWLTENNYFKNSIIDYQEHIGTYKTVTVNYDYGIDFSDFINSITSIFDIEIFAEFTLLDILTGVIGVFVLVWFLKVFAGG